MAIWLMKFGFALGRVTPKTKRPRRSEAFPIDYSGFDQEPGWALPITVDGSTFTPGPIVDETAMRWI